MASPSVTVTLSCLCLILCGSAAGQYYCNDTFLTEETGVISSPGWPYRYDNNQRCEWEILLGPNQHIAINFTYMETEECCDYVEIEYDEDPSVNRSFTQRFAGSRLPAPFLIATNRAVVRFYSDGSDARRGFSLVYNSVSTVPDWCPKLDIEASVSEENGTAEVEIAPGVVITFSPGVHEVNFHGMGCSYNVIVSSKNYPQTCPKYLSAIADVATRMGTFSLTSGDSIFELTLPQGAYDYTYRMLDQNCTTKFLVADGRLRRKLDFTADYKIKCSMLAKMNVFITDLAKQKYREIEQMCSGTCRRSQTEAVRVSCVNDTTTIAWPTDRTFLGDVDETPESFLEPLLPSMKSHTLLDIVEYETVPRIVYPERDANGQTVRTLLRSFCIDNYKLDTVTNSCRSA